MSEITEISTQSEEIQSNRAPGELQNIQAAYHLNGKNYLKWSQLVRTLLKGKGKLSHLLGTGPKEGESGFEAWDEEDSLIMSWLWNSMTPEISDTCMFLPSAQGIWEAIRQTYSKVRDAALVYEIKVKTGSTKQEGKSVNEYANLLENQWQELDYYRVIELKCSNCAAAMKDLIEKDRVYDFLAGLNPEFDQVRVQILGKEEVPSLNEAISLVRAEESRRSVMLEPQTVEASAMVSIGKSSRNDPSRQAPDLGKADFTKGGQNRDNRDNLWCTYCKKPRHTKERCWKLHGKSSTSSREWGYKGGQHKTQGQV